MTIPSGEEFVQQFPECRNYTAKEQVYIPKDHTTTSDLILKVGNEHDFSLG